MESSAQCWRAWTAWTSSLPPVVLLAYFLITWGESFPITANTNFMVNELKFSAPTVTTYYAVTFMPFLWKPLYGWISDNFPIAGKQRSPYIAISAAGQAVFFIAMAACVHSAASAFAVATLQNACGAFLQLMVGAFLVDVARRDVKQSAALQSLANATKWAGTFTAQFAALFIYAKPPFLFSSRQAIALTAVAPILIALSVPWFQEAPISNSGSACCCSRRRGQSCAKLSGGSVRVALVVALVQPNLVVIGCKTLMQQENWELALASTFLLTLFLGCFAFYGLRNWRRTPQIGSEVILREGEVDSANGFGRRWARIALFCFCANAIPSSGVTVGLLQLSVFTYESYQTLQIVSSFASICAALAFGGGFHRRPVTHAIAVSVVLAVVAGLAPLPFAFVAIDDSQGTILRNTGTLWSPMGALGIFSSVVGSISTIFTVLPIDTLVTCAAGREGCERSSTALAVYLSAYSFGATVAGLVSAPLLSAMGLEGKNWQSLPAWIIGTAFSKLLILLLLPLLPSLAASETEPMQGQGSVEQSISLEAEQVSPDTVRI